jgi:hypothetical protein
MYMSYKKTTIGKDTKKERKVPSTYVPKTLSKEDKKKQEKSILEKKKRPKLESFESKRSPFTVKFEKMYGYKVSNKSKIAKELLSLKGQELILDKGKSAYFSSGSRPNQNPFSWAYARLASALVGGKSERIDKDILIKYGKGKFKERMIKKYKNE